MGRRIVHCLLFLILGLLISSGPSVAEKEASMGQKKGGNNPEKQTKFSSSISITQMDVTTPITTVPTLNPTAPSSTTPLVNPATTTTPPTSSGGSWCVASQTASQTALQVALDYACGYGGADCAAIQPAGSCYNPNTLHDHASYAFNNYYQKKPLPTSCNFGGTAVVTSTDPSSGTCQYPSTSTSSSVLNTTNPNGATVFGSQPASSSSSAVAMPRTFPQFLVITCIMVLLLPRDED